LIFCKRERTPLTPSALIEVRRLASATEFADQIERELLIVEAQQAPGNDPADSLSNSGLHDSSSLSIVPFDGLGSTSNSNVISAACPTRLEQLRLAPAGG